MFSTTFAATTCEPWGATSEMSEREKKREKGGGTRFGWPNPCHLSRALYVFSFAERNPNAEQKGHENFNSIRFPQAPERQFSYPIQAVIE